jgi:predicted GNAT superfamily acetyltransferase
MNIRRLEHNDIASGWSINEQGLPGTGQITEVEFADLLSLCEVAVGVFENEEMLGFVLCLLPKTRYASLNYAWFNERYSSFLYVDRIAVAEKHRDKGVGSILYGYVIEHARQIPSPVVAEVNLTPPNPGSIRFHERHGFSQVGVFNQGEKSVAMMLHPVKGLID